MAVSIYLMGEYYSVQNEAISAVDKFRIMC